MDRKVCISLVILALMLAGSDMTAFAGNTASIDVAVAVSFRQPMPTPSSWSPVRLADGVAVEEAHRRVLGGFYTPALNPKGPDCLGPCLKPGQPYTDHGCKSFYLCRSKPP
ncbi:hypothetical protein ZWY2020_026674 [Hordeum vulgare]|nr:hypothetical protein ZWY2020_026674 [Hordeum vulgare]